MCFVIILHVYSQIKSAKLASGYSVKRPFSAAASTGGDNDQPSRKKRCVCVCVCPGFMTQKTLEDTGSTPRAVGKKEKQKTSQVLQPTSPPICKTGTWSCTNGSGGTTGCPHRQWEAWLVPPASSLPGLQECS